MAKPKERKSLTIDISYPIHLDSDRRQIIREETARMIGQKVEEAIMADIEPDFLETTTGWIPRPGIYRFRLDFIFEKEAVRVY
jgi:hypothetical protein